MTQPLATQRNPPPAAPFAAFVSRPGSSLSSSASVSLPSPPRTADCVASPWSVPSEPTPSTADRDVRRCLSEGFEELVAPQDAIVIELGRTGYEQECRVPLDPSCLVAVEFASAMEFRFACLSSSRASDSRGQAGIDYPLGPLAGRLQGPLVPEGLQSNGTVRPDLEHGRHGRVVRQTSSPVPIHTIRPGFLRLRPCAILEHHNDRRLELVRRCRTWSCKLIVRGSTPSGLGQTIPGRKCVVQRQSSGHLDK